MIARADRDPTTRRGSRARACSGAASVLAASALFVIGATSGCGVVTIEPTDGCDYDGHHYALGASFPANDGCNGCSCTANGVACTVMACVTTCNVGGHAYAVGEKFIGPDGCNTCTCNADTTITCTTMACGVCTYGGSVYAPGQSFPAADGCNTCTCMKDGAVACTERACAVTCTYAGKTYTAGESFPALDGCNTCTCGSDGSVGCTKMACACSPKDEWYRKYVATSPSQCAVIDFLCPSNTTYFANACGCGCEQSSSCPQWFNCMPPASCDETKIKTECPYSGIAY